MALRIYKRKSLGSGRYVGLSRRGIALGQRAGRVSISNRGLSFRIVPGVTWRMPFRRR